MAKVICTVCGREIDSRGLSGHMKTHKAKPKEDDTDGVISYPSGGESTHPEGDESADEIGAQGKPAARSMNAAHPKDSGVKKAVKKTVASKPASKPESSPASKPDPRGQRKSDEEWLGFFR